MEGEPYFRHLQTSNFCEEAVNKSERPEGKYEEGDRNKWSHNLEEEEEHHSLEEPMYQDLKEEPEDLTSSIERLRRSALTPFIL